MGYLCDFCGERRAMVYCRSDVASLCLLCDRKVHSANVVSRRHSRVLLCQRCNAQAASVWCVDEEIPLCQNCDANAHGQGQGLGSTSSRASAHKRMTTINFHYSGCPSSSELSQLWSSIPEFEVPCMEDYYDASVCELGLHLLTINQHQNVY
uniref:B box-type domain-containing protein n=1 Tax=Nelumbo nucifera TaxID=4432 RepID=A0A822XXK4_NELNU|nr:TPA_asm: hypothetical protein HUJ06_025302 [Nelumbo nucifera]